MSLKNSRQISNKEFQEELNKKENQYVITFYTQKFGSKLSKEERTICGMTGLWKALSVFDKSRNCKLVTLLGKCVQNECMYYNKEIYKFYKKVIVKSNIYNTDLTYKNSIENQLDNQIIIKTLLKQLNLRERDILQSYYMHNMTYEEIGKKYKVTRQRIEQILSEIKTKLRNKNPNPLLV